MKLKIIYFVLLFLIANLGFAATMLRDNGFETGNLNGWKPHTNGGTFSIATSPVRTGNYSGKFDLQFVSVAADNYRAETYLDPETLGRFDFEQEYWFSFNYYYADWVKDSSSEIAPFQIHVRPGSWAPECKVGTSAVNVAPFLMLTSNDQERFYTYERGIMWQAPIVKNQWQTITAHFRISTGSTGYIEAWKNGNFIGRINGANSPAVDSCNIAIRTPYFNMGVYKWDWRTGRAATQSSRRTLYTDNFKLAKGADGFNQVYTAPSGAAPPDTTAPILSAITSTNITSTSATVTFTSNEASDTRVDYGTTTAYGSNVTNASLVTSHSINITGLTAATTYNYKVTSKDSSNNTTVSGNFTFTTSAATPEPEPTASYRINAGGPLLTDTTDWSVDTVALPSPYVNAVAMTNKVASTTATINMTDTSIVVAPPPMALFQKDRYDPNGLPEMAWTFPTEVGSTYRVNLYFAETFGNTSIIGGRKFDVTIEGLLVLDDYDIFADVGANKAVKKTFDVVSDGNLNINFGHVVENPKINGIEIFKISDTTPPIISDIQTTTTTTTATVTWLTNEAATSRIAFSTPISTTQFYPELVNFHSILIENLQPGTTYTFKLTSRDEFFNFTETGVLTFTTAATAPPIISSLFENNVTETSFTADWTTNVASNSVVNYGLTSAYGQMVSSGALETAHSVLITNLTGNTEYHFQACSTDINNLTACSTDQIVQTEFPQAQVISNIGVVRAPTSLTITYTTSQLGDGIVRWGSDLTLANTENTVESVTSHSKTITGLVPNTRYYFKVGSTSIFGVDNESALQTERTTTVSTLESDEF